MSREGLFLSGCYNGVLYPHGLSTRTTAGEVPKWS